MVKSEKWEVKSFLTFDFRLFGVFPPCGRENTKVAKTHFSLFHLGEKWAKVRLHFSLFFGEFGKIVKVNFHFWLLGFFFFVPTTREKWQKLSKLASFWLLTFHFSPSTSNDLRKAEKKERGKRKGKEGRWSVQKPFHSYHSPPSSRTVSPTIQKPTHHETFGTLSKTCGQC